jgi:hypothetical protein
MRMRQYHKYFFIFDTDINACPWDGTSRLVNRVRQGPIQVEHRTVPALRAGLPVPTRKY